MIYRGFIKSSMPRKYRRSGWPYNYGRTVELLPLCAVSTKVEDDHGFLEKKADNISRRIHKESMNARNPI